MAVKCYDIAGAYIGFDCVENIDSSERFENFRSEKEPEITFKIIKAELPEKSGEKLFSDDKRAYFSDSENEYMFTSFYDGSIDGFIEYACRVMGKNGNYLYVDYNKLWEVMLFDALNLPDILIRQSIAVMHTSFIVKDGFAVLFTADKQIGKSTQAALWEKYRGAVIINGDRAALRKDGDSLIACGVPFRGSSKVSLSASIPVKAIVVLGQAKENTIKKLSPSEAFRDVLGKFTYDTWNELSLSAAVDMAAFTAEKIPVYRLLCLPDESAVECLENEIKI